MRSQLTLSLCSFASAGHCLSRELGAQGLQIDPKIDSRRYILVHFFFLFFLLFLETLCHKSCKAKNRNKIELLPNLQQEIKGVGGMRENMWRISFFFFFWLAFLSVILKDQNGEHSCHYHVCLPYYYTIIWVQRMRRHLLKALGYSIWWPQYSLSAILGKLTFRGAPPNSECTRAWSVWHVCAYMCTHMQTDRQTDTHTRCTSHTHIIQVTTALSNHSTWFSCHFNSQNRYLLH